MVSAATLVPPHVMGFTREDSGTVGYTLIGVKRRVVSDAFLLQILGQVFVFKENPRKKLP